MSSKKLIIIASLLSFCLCLPQKRNCDHPHGVVELIKCQKTSTGAIRYGKRSVSQPGPFFQKLQSFLRNYEEEDYPDRMLYRILTPKREE